jgi:hypothetical protein
LAAKADHKLLIRLVPMGGKDRRIGLEALVSGLQAIHGALVRGDRLLSGGRITTRYEIADLSTNSPPRIVLDPRPLDRKTDRREAVVGGFLAGLQSVGRGAAPEYYDRPMLEKVREIASGVSRRRIRTEIGYQSASAEINHIFERRILSILDQSEKSFGSIEGRMEALNLHAGSNLCAIYPIAGAKKITCHFPEHLRDDIKAGIDKSVLVTGTLSYAFKDRFPRHIEARNVQIVDEQQGFPSLDELRGIAKNAFGDEDSVDLVSQVRDGWR